MATSEPAVTGRNRRSVSRVGMVLALAACGCSGSDTTFAPVEGTVTRNGKPVAHVEVIFMAEADSRGPRAKAVTDDDGRFRLMTDDGRNGAPVGRHRVCVIDTTVAAERLGIIAKRHGLDGPVKSAAPKPAGKGPSISPVYARPEETPLRAEVRPGAQTIDFQVP